MVGRRFVKEKKMNFLKTVAAGLAAVGLAFSATGALAAEHEKTKVGFVYVGPVGARDATKLASSSWDMHAEAWSRKLSS